MGALIGRTESRSLDSRGCWHSRTASRRWRLFRLVPARHGAVHNQAQGLLHSLRPDFHGQVLEVPEHRVLDGAGKIVIAVTHDDLYFDVADRIVTMDQGKVRSIVTREPTPDSSHAE